MIRTYTGTTMLGEDLTNATFDVRLRDTNERVKYTGIRGWSIVEGGKEAAEIEALGDGSCVDENHNYLILHYEDGREATFRNSHVDLFVY